jgi:malonyl-CoA decarboxylase
MNVSFFGELLQAISERGRAFMDRAREKREPSDTRSSELVDLCGELLSKRGEASGVALARDILTRYAELKPDRRVRFFESLARSFGPDRDRIAAAIAAWERNRTDAAIAELHEAAEPRRQELFRRLNLAPGGTKALVAMREHLMDAEISRDDFEALDADFIHLFTSWFNRGFLVLQQIGWSSPAIVLEKIIRYEAVHEIQDWADLRLRIDAPDRRCYAFFHPALVDEPLIFVEVALTENIPAAIAPILAAGRDILAPRRATTATFYSISNCQRGLTGVSFGHFLLKQVVEEISRELPGLTTFVTLSPVPGFADWLGAERAKEHSAAINPDDRGKLALLEQPNWWLDEETAEELREPVLRAAASYFLGVRTRRGTPVNAVARFHLGNGARLEQIDWLADTSPKGMRQSHGLMVNYLYDLGEIERNHEAYAESRTIAASNSIRRLARNSMLHLLPVSG